MSGGALETGRDHFNLKTEEQIVAFIGAGGLGTPKFKNTYLWKKNPNPEDPIMVDAYTFHSGKIYGYIAFRHHPKTNKWIIKSFKDNERQELKHTPFTCLEKISLDRKGE